MKVQNGDTIVFNTDPPQQAVVIGTPGNPIESYGLIFGTAGAPDARAMSQEQLDQALADGLIQVIPKAGHAPPEPAPPAPKKTKPKKKAATAKKPATIVPPWGKK